jgi:hypothetical protein
MARADDRYPPRRYGPEVKTNRYDMPFASAGKISDRLAGLYADGTTEIREPARSRTTQSGCYPPLRRDNR